MRIIISFMWYKNSCENQNIIFFSIFGVYILVRYGKSPLLALIVALLYSFIFLQTLLSSYHMLNGLS